MLKLKDFCRGDHNAFSCDVEASCKSLIYLERIGDSEREMFRSDHSVKASKFPCEAVKKNGIDFRDTLCQLNRGVGVFCTKLCKTLTKRRLKSRSNRLRAVDSKSRSSVFPA